MTQQEILRARAEAIAAYVAQNAGSYEDLDPTLEDATIEHLLTTSDRFSPAIN